ncbi:unnamed protein product [Symbiodinium sp. CCMP2592]|nr:unnamed protein product [Symbiodinium sp. CCMP2592]
MSVAKASAITAAFVADGCRGVSAKNLAGSARNRDFWRWMRLPFQPYTVKLPLLARNSLDKHIVYEPVAMILPTDMIEQMYKKKAFGVSIFGPSGKTSLKEYWQAEDQSWINDIGLTPAAFDTCIPMFWHEDSVPSFKDESYTFWSWTALSELGSWQIRVCLVGLASSRVVPETKTAIMKVLAWNLRYMAEGLHPTVDENEMPWPNGSKRQLKSGTPEHCLMEKVWSGNLGLRRPVALEGSAWLSEVQSMHILHLGTLRDVIASVLVDYLQSRDLHRFVGLGDDAPFDDVLHRFTHDAKRWAHDHHQELSIKPLNRAMLALPAKSETPLVYPELTSRIKAARVKVLLMYLTHEAELDDCDAEVLFLRQAGQLQEPALDQWHQDPRASPWWEHARSALAASDPVLVTTFVDSFVAATTLAGEPLPSELLAEASALPPNTSVHLGWVARNLLQPDGYITAACQEVCLQLFGGLELPTQLSRFSDAFRTAEALPAHEAVEERIPADAALASAAIAARCQERTRPHGGSGHPCTEQAAEPATAATGAVARGQGRARGRGRRGRAQRVPGIEAGVRRGLAQLHELDLPAELRRRVLTLQGAPRKLRGTLRFALRTGLSTALDSREPLLREAAGTRPAGQARPTTTAEPVRAARAAHLVQLGELSAAARALTAAPQPHSACPLPESVLLGCLRGARRGSAAGPSGATNEHLRLLLDEPADGALLHRAAERLANADVPEQVLAAVRLGRMVALRKLNGRVRALVVGDVSCGV